MFLKGQNPFKLPLINYDKSARQIRRFYHRYFTGVGVGGRIRLLTLTSSDEAVGKGLDSPPTF